MGRQRERGRWGDIPGRQDKPIYSSQKLFTLFISILKSSVWDMLFMSLAVHVADIFKVFKSKRKNLFLSPCYSFLCLGLMQ